MGVQNLNPASAGYPGQAQSVPSKTSYGGLHKVEFLDLQIFTASFVSVKMSSREYKSWIRSFLVPESTFYRLVSRLEII